MVLVRFHENAQSEWGSRHSSFYKIHTNLYYYYFVCIVCACVFQLIDDDAVLIVIEYYILYVAEANNAAIGNDPAGHVTQQIVRDAMAI